MTIEESSLDIAEEASQRLATGHQSACFRGATVGQHIALGHYAITARVQTQRLLWANAITTLSILLEKQD